MRTVFNCSIKLVKTVSECWQMLCWAAKSDNLNVQVSFKSQPGLAWVSQSVLNPSRLTSGGFLSPLAVAPCALLSLRPNLCWTVRKRNCDGGEFLAPGRRWSLSLYRWEQSSCFLNICGGQQSSRAAEGRERAELRYLRSRTPPAQHSE